MMGQIILAIVSFFTMAASTVALSEVTLNPSRTIIINGPITGNIVGPVSDALDKLAKDTSEPVDLVIASPGGSVVAGYLLIDKMESLKNSGLKFRCTVRQVAASMAFQILLHCDERNTTPYAFLLWHPVRIFFQGALTSDVAKIAATQLKDTDEIIRADLYANLPMKKATIDWHFTNETLHHAKSLVTSCPGFFNYVGIGIRNLYNDSDVVLNTAELGGFSMQAGGMVYIHERFIVGNTVDAKGN